ncbi:MAG: energy-coupling factor transporter transmembrane component T family protein [Anaerolineae bacterium]
MSGQAKLQYRPLQSWLHTLHPLTKLGWLLVITVASLAVHHPWYAGLVVVGLWSIARTAGIRPGKDLRGWQLIVATAGIFFALHVLFTRSGAVLLDLRPTMAFWITRTGLERGMLVALRFVAIILASQLFVLSTDSSALAYALMRAGLPYRYGFALVTAIRLAPLFELEANTVYQAQLARGVRYDGSVFRRIIEVLRQLLLPLLVGALRRADHLAVSMEGRQFGRYRDRTYLRQARVQRADIISWIAMLLFVIGSVLTAISA